MIGCRDMDRVDVGPIEHPTIVLDSFEFRSGLTTGQLLKALIETCFVDIADDGVLDILQILEKQIGDLPAASSRADKGHPNAIRSVRDHSAVPAPRE